MSENKVEFSKDNIDLYFKELSKEYKKLGGRNTPVEIILIGGAAIVESYGFRDMTTDIDAIIPAIGIMKDAINHIGDRFGLPSGWINADFMQTPSYSPKLAEYSKHYRTFNQILDVRYVSGEYLIAMKLKSGRQYKNDLSDIIGILAEHEKDGSPITYEKISDAVVNLYGGWDEISEKSVSFIKAVLENKSFTEMYEAIRENEQNAKAVLISFDEKHPGIISDANADQFIERSDETGESKASVLAALNRLKAKNKDTKSE